MPIGSVRRLHVGVSQPKPGPGNTAQGEPANRAQAAKPEQQADIDPASRKKSGRKGTDRRGPLPRPLPPTSRKKSDRKGTRSKGTRSKRPKGNLNSKPSQRELERPPATEEALCLQPTEEARRSTLHEFERPPDT